MAPARQKLHSQAGVARLVLILLIAALVLLAVVLVPMLAVYYNRADSRNCSIGIRSAQRKLANSYLLEGDLTQEEAEQAATQAVKDFRDLCPSGGEIYLLKGGETGYTVVCGLHDPDYQERAHLNAGRVLARLEEELSRQQILSEDPAPETLSVMLNSQELIAVRDEARQGLRYGTNATLDLDGTLASYDLEDGEIVWFNFADEHCSVTWTEADGWSDLGIVSD